MTPNDFPDAVMTAAALIVAAGTLVETLSGLGAEVRMVRRLFGTP